MHLRTPIPTLEPDDAFVARLSALAAAGAPVAAEPRSPVSTVRVVLAAAGVAAILVGVAWLAGLNPTGNPQPAPGPATSPSAPESSGSAAPNPSSAQPGPDAGLAIDAQGVTVSETSAGRPPAAQASGHPGQQPGATTSSTAAGGAPGTAPGIGTGPSGTGDEPARGRGPDAHAGDHPDGHATTKANNGTPRNVDDKPERGPKKPEDPEDIQIPGSNARR